MPFQNDPAPRWANAPITKSQKAVHGRGAHGEAFGEGWIALDRVRWRRLVQLIGLKVPFYLGAATYGIFWWLDNNIADEHSQVISSWLHGRSQHKPDLGNLIITIFDRIYTSPLLSLRAFRRSAAISTVSWLLIYFVPHFMVLFGFGFFHLDTILLYDVISVLFTWF